MFLGTFVTLKEETISFVCPSAWNNSTPTGRNRWNLIFSLFFNKICRENSTLLKSDKNNGTLHEDVFTFMTISRWILLRIRNVLDRSCRENQNTRFMFNNFFPKTCQKMAHTRCMLDKQGYKRTHACTRPRARAHTRTEICNTYCFFTATMVTRRRLIVTLYVHCLSSCHPWPSQ